MIHPTGFFIERADGGPTTSSTSNRIPVQMGIKPYNFNVQKRGFEPEYLHLHYTDNRFDQLNGLVNLVFMANGKTEVYKNWVVVRRYRYDSLTKVILLADVRHLLTYAEFTGGYNISAPGTDEENIIREGSGLDGFPWTDGSALVDAIETMLRNVGAPGNIQVSMHIGVVPKTLPYNLGNSPYGGFHGARLNVVGPILAFNGDLDLVPTQSGDLMIVDKYAQVLNTNVINSLKPSWTTAVEPDDRRPERPSMVIYTFGKRVERRFRYSENVQLTAPPATFTLDVIENVMPVYDSDDGKHEELFTYVFRESAYNRREVLRRALIPGFYPWAQDRFVARLLAQGAEFIAKLQHIAGHMPSVFRARYRVMMETRGGEALQPYVDIQLGHLKPDGTTADGGSVYMNYVRHLRFSVASPHERLQDDILNQEFTQNVPFRADKPAPFTASWLVGTDKELIFEVIPDETTRLYRYFIPGELVQPFRYPSGAEMERGEPWGIIEATMELSPNFQLEVAYNGYQVEARPDDPVRYEIQMTMDGSSPVPLYWPVEEVEALINERGELINEDTINAVIDHYHEQLEKNYEDSRHGTLEFPGLVPSEITVAGVLHSKFIRVGHEADHSISTLLHIASGIDEFKPFPVNFKGVPPRKIG